MSKPDSEAPIPIPFDIGSLQLLASGQSRHTLAVGKRLISHGMVIAEGGENTMHAHYDEEHVFLVLSGHAHFAFVAPQKPILLTPLQGILIPAGCFYSFCSTGTDNLTFVRVGTARDSNTKRVGLDGQELRGKSSEAGWQAGILDHEARNLRDLFEPQ